MRGSFRILLAAVFFVVCALAGVPTYGQGGATGAIDGVVTDTTGAAVEGADVQVIDQRTEALARKVQTSTDGAFIVTLLPPGTYTVVVNKPGFAEAKSEAV
ncbi:MAG: carboxypeptidase regulatory-like domain-containing protein, partial [Acidobacteria bacterium]|nr:carboxypeptidase regulatory-like domain-containing protein [Acidobacteriota bacterium]